MVSEPSQHGAGREPFFTSGVQQTVQGVLNHLEVEPVFPQGGRGRQPWADTLPTTMAATRLPQAWPSSC